MFTFDVIKGHTHIIRHMQNAISTGRVGHAYIFEGERGMGKKTLAKAFAKTLQCEQGGVNPCNVCLSCRVFESGNHPDVMYVKASKTKSIGVDDVREQIILPMSEKPFRYKYKIFIADEADTLTPAAQNALLKTIEEPASFGVFLLLAARTRQLLPTVQSRCVPFKLKPLPDAIVEGVLREHNLPENMIGAYTVFAHGNIGKALSLAGSEEFAETRQLAMYIACHIHAMDIVEVFGLYARLEKWKESIQSLLDMLYMCYRDLIVYKETQTIHWLTQPDEQDAYESVTAAVSLKALYKGVDAITQTKRVLRHNGNFQLALELMLLRLSGQDISYTA